MVDGHYIAYLELHEIPWEVEGEVRFQTQASSGLVGLGRGPYTVPRFASPTVTIRAGGSVISTANENYTLEGETYVSVALPIESGADGLFIAANQEWPGLARLAEDVASTVSLCLRQRTPPKKVAEYVLKYKEGRPSGEIIRWSAFGAASAAVSQDALQEIDRALMPVLDRSASPQTLLAMRWYNNSRTAIGGADRLLSLWIALEALVGRGGQGVVGGGAQETGERRL